MLPPPGDSPDGEHAATFHSYQAAAKRQIGSDSSPRSDEKRKIVKYFLLDRDADIAIRFAGNVRMTE